MFDILRQSFKTGIVTTSYPDSPAVLPENARGCPAIDFAHWKDARPAVAACPTRALSIGDSNGRRKVQFDLAACSFCALCAESDPAIRMTNVREFCAGTRAEFVTIAEYDLARDGTQKSLVNLNRGSVPAMDGTNRSIEALGKKLGDEIRRVLRRSLHIREVDAGSCNGCEIEIVGLNSPVYDVERFGIHFVASPRHADVLLVTGPVSRNMELALRKTYDATPAPRLVIAAGACACSGGIFGRNYATVGGVENVVPVDVYVPGCPPTPYALLQGLLAAMGRFKTR